MNTSPTLITKTLYIPIEIIDRELGGGILLAAEAVSRGWKVVLGGKQGIFSNMSRFKSMPGVFYMKSIVPGEVFKQQEIMADGHRIVSLDVEGLVPSNGEAGVKLRYSQESIAFTDFVFFWGKHHFETVCAVYPEVEGKAVVSGSPIIDETLLLRARNQIADRGSTRPKILIGTSCGYANHMSGIEFSRTMTRDAYGKNVDRATVLELEREAVMDQKLFEFWKTAVPCLSDAFRDCEIVLRPHPSENKDVWRSLLRSHTNVRIDEGRSILAEMLQSDIYVHFNSTSALTSSILGIPTFMPMPGIDQALADRVTFVKRLSITAESVNELVKKIQESLQDNRPNTVGVDLAHYCENLKPNSFQASQRIMDVIENGYRFSNAAARVRRQAIKERVVVDLKKMKRFALWSAGVACASLGIKPPRVFPHRNFYKSANAKQPKTDVKKVHGLMAQLLDHELLEHVVMEQKATNLFIMHDRRFQ